MKVLLIFPPLSIEERYSKKVGNVGGHLAPLGIAYMSSGLLKEGHEVKIIDAPSVNFDNDDVLREVDKFEPDFVGMTALTTIIHRVIELSKKIKELYPDVTLGIGGPHATILPNETLRETNADFVLVGEGELTIKDVLKNLKNLKKNEVIIGKPVKNLDSILFPARQLLPMERYMALPNNYKRSPNVVNMIASRGCPFKCTYCCKDIYGEKYRVRSINNVIEEINHLIKNYKTAEIAFWDDIFTMKKKWVMELCEKMIKDKIDITWSCETRVNLVDREMLNLMKKAGCWNIFYGIETADQQLLDNIEKGVTINQIRKAIDLTKQSGIEIRGSFMVALPGETPELARKMIKFAIELDPDYAQFSITTPFPGTKLYNEFSKWGNLSKNFNEYNEWSPVFVPFGYKNAEEIKKIHREAFRKFYFRPTYFLKRLMKIRTLKDIKRNITGMRMLLGFNSTPPRDFLQKNLS